MALLEVDNLHTQFFTRQGVVKAVDGISFTVEAGKTLGIVGESGCGKSVTALSLMGLIPKPPARIVEGSVMFQGRDLTKLSERELEDVRGKEMAMIFQDPMTSLNPTLRIKTQITEVLDRHYGYSKDEAVKKAIELLEEVQIPRAAERLNDYPHRFSGGMRQRVMIAIALACNPKLLLADEPTTALDVTVQAEILDLLEELRREHDMGMIIITHDMGVIAETADEVAVMYAGQFVEQTETQELFDHPSIRTPRRCWKRCPSSRARASGTDGCGRSLDGRRISSCRRRVVDLRRDVRMRTSETAVPNSFRT
jgi:ABC-type dipeptide/oligopeptide/nickel transport system ATPase component